MKIDPKVEKPLRRAYVAVIDKNMEGIAPVLRPLNEKQSEVCLRYAVIVVDFVMHEIFGEDTDAEAADVMAERVVARVSEWFDLGETHDVSAFLNACISGDATFGGVDPDDVMLYAIVLGGEFLAHHTPDGMNWWEYLDQIWNYAESQPDPA